MAGLELRQERDRLRRERDRFRSRLLAEREGRRVEREHWQADRDQWDAERARFAAERHERERHERERLAAERQQGEGGAQEAQAIQNTFFLEAQTHAVNTVADRLLEAQTRYGEMTAEQVAEVRQHAQTQLELRSQIVGDNYEFEPTEAYLTL
jgi:hypothetical protein